MAENSKAKQGYNPRDYYRDTPKSGTPAGALLSSARLKMLKPFPFYGKLALSMTLVESDQVETTQVDPKGRMYYNPKWVNAMTFEDAIFEFGHEIMHLVQRLFSRRGNRNMQIFNLAADYCADTILVDSGMKQSFASKLMVGQKEFDLVHKLKLVEKVYDHILQEQKENTDCKACKQAYEKLQKQVANENKEDQKARDKAAAEADKQGEEQGDGGSGEGEGSDSHSHGSGGSPCEHGNGEGSPSEGGEGGSGEGEGGETPHTCGGIRKCCAGSSADIDQSSPTDVQKMIQNVIAAKMYAEGKGNIPGILGEQIDALTKSKVRWQDYLKTASNKIFAGGRYTFKRPNRRGHAFGIRLQKQKPESKTAVIAVDTSGSMGRDAIVQCITEAAAVIHASGCEKLWLILHDCAIYYSGYVGLEDLSKIPIQSGGTSHIPVFQCIDRTYEDEDKRLPHGEDCELAIMFTDLGTDFPAEHPSYPVIWGVPDPSAPGMAASVPFGTKVPVEM